LQKEKRDLAGSQPVGSFCGKRDSFLLQENMLYLKKLRCFLKKQTRGGKMKVSFDVQLTSKDLFRFNMYQTYTTTQGPVSIILAILVFVMAGTSIRSGAADYGVLYIVVGIVFLAYIPLTLWTRAKQTMKKNEVLAGVLHYTVSAEGIEVSQKDDTGMLGWKEIYKMISTKSQVLIYSNRVNAYIIPREQLGDQYEDLKAIAKEQLESYRFRMR
jgi:type IV secretory pathway VirB2 component (pilin)